MPSRVRFAAIAVAGCLLSLPLASQTASAQADTGISLVLHLYDYAGVPRDILQRAQAETCRVYRGIGVDVQWVEGGTKFECHTLPMHLAVAILSTEMVDRKGSREDAMGVAPGTREERGRIGYVFYQRVSSTAASQGHCVSEILGVVMAHEVGHLLLPFGSHSTEGVMRAEWDRRHMLLAASGVLGFTRPQGDVIRETLTRVGVPGGLSAGK